MEYLRTYIINNPDSLNILSILGDIFISEQRYQEVIDTYNRLLVKEPKNINFHYIRKKNSPTILKKRFLDNISNSKVLGVYKLNDDPLARKEENFFNFAIKITQTLGCPLLHLNGLPHLPSAYQIRHL